MTYITDVYLSEILKKDVVDQFGRKLGILWDISIVPGLKYPAANKVILKNKRQYMTYRLSMSSFLIILSLRSTR
jgi:sporulation protein YlmC with PRC-barrel domain